MTIKFILNKYKILLFITLAKLQGHIKFEFIIFNSFPQSYITILF